MPSRTALATYAATQYAELASLAGISDDDSQDGFKIPIDKTLRLWRGDDEEAAEVLMDYFTLSFFSKKLAGSRDSNVSGSGGVSFGKRTERTQLREDLAEAREQCKLYDYDVEPSVWGMGSIEGNYLTSGGRGY